MDFFVKSDSIVRKIWGKSDTVLFIFAGAAAEFALNKAVDWLYFTGKLPADPIGRLFSTVTYARMIVFSKTDDALKAIDKISSIHAVVEKNRGASIPDWAYRDVLFMLIHYSIAAYELLERKLTEEEKQEVYDVFYRLGKRMQLKDLPDNYTDWLPMRDQHMEANLEKTNYSIDLFLQYKKHLGKARYQILKQAQLLVVPQRVKTLLNFGNISWLKPAVPLYKFSRIIKLDGFVKAILLPSDYKKQIREIDVK
ncbi:MAG: oxygenase MpaB family protein [Flavisolibacter sp.]